jgi:hypothetical protein
MMCGFPTEEWTSPNLRVEKENMRQTPQPWAVVPPTFHRIMWWRMPLLVESLLR